MSWVGVPDRVQVARRSRVCIACTCVRLRTALPPARPPACALCCRS